LRTAEPWRPLPVTLFPAGDSAFGAEDDWPPSVETATLTRSDGQQIGERNSVQLIYAWPKNGLFGLLSAQNDSLSLKSFGLFFTVATTGALHVVPLSSEYDTARSSGALFGGYGLRPGLNEAS